jgi:hypothetical protein
LQEIHPLTSYVLKTLTTEKNLSTDNFVNHFEDTNKLGKNGYNWFARFCKKTKPKCIQIIDLFSLKDILSKRPLMS